MGVGMTMQWFRLYSRIIDDKKIKLLAFEDRWHFVALCCLKSSGELDEVDGDLRSRQVAVALGVQLAELDEILRRLRAVKLIDSDMQPVKWDSLQFKRDNSTERVQAHRERKQNQPRNDMKRGETVSKRPPETETDTETELASNEACASADALKPEHIQEKWNETATAIGRPLIRTLTPERRQLLKGRITQYALEDFVTVFAKIRGSPFLRGDARWQGVTFDWVFKKANFQKILEGNYDG